MKFLIKLNIPGRGNLPYQVEGRAIQLGEFGKFFIDHRQPIHGVSPMNGYVISEPQSGLRVGAGPTVRDAYSDALDCLEEYGLKTFQARVTFLIKREGVLNETQD